MHRMKHPTAVLLIMVTLLAAARSARAAFIESFTTNPEVESPQFNKAAPFLWVTLGQVLQTLPIQLRATLWFSVQNTLQLKPQS